MAVFRDTKTGKTYGNNGKKDEEEKKRTMFTDTRTGKTYGPGETASRLQRLAEEMAAEEAAKQTRRDSHDVLHGIERETGRNAAPEYQARRNTPQTTADVADYIGRQQRATGDALQNTRIANTLIGAVDTANAGYLGTGATLADLAQRYNIGAMYNTTEDWQKATQRAKEEPSWKIVDTLHAKEDAIRNRGQQKIEKAKEGLGAVGRTLVDVGVSGTQMLGDAAINLIAPGAGLTAMGVRAFGNAAADARQRGANVARQAGYGAAVAGIEVISEKLFDGLAGLYGEGIAGDFTGMILDKMAKNPLLGKALSALGTTGKKIISSAGNEAIEEVFSGIIDPALEAIIDGKTGYSADTLADIGQSALVGAILGAFGGTVDVMKDSGVSQAEIEGAQNAEKYADLVQQQKSAQDYYTKVAQQYGPFSQQAQQAREEVLKPAQQRTEAARRQAGAQSNLPTPAEYEDAAAAKSGKFFNRMGDEAVRAIVNEGMDSEEGTESRTLAEQYKIRLDNGEKLTENEIGRLYRANLEAIEGEARQQNQSVREYTTERTAPQAITGTDGALYVNQFARDALKNGNMTPAAVRALSNGYDGQTNAPEYVRGFLTAYEAGMSGQDVKNVRAQGLSDTQIKAAYEAGKAVTSQAQQAPTQALEQRTDVQYNNAASQNMEAGKNGERTDLLHGSSERAYGESAAEQAGGMAETAERDQGGNESWKETAARSADGGAAGLTVGKAINTAAFGIADGSTEDTIYEVIGGETAHTIEANRIAKENGLNLHLFVGDNLHFKSAGAARGFIIGKDVYVRADHPRFTADQIVLHESGHDMIDRGEIDPDTVRERIERIYGEDHIQEIAERYASAYDGMTAEEAWTEIICDSIGNMNIFSGVLETIAEEHQQVLTDVRKATENSAKQERGPPSEETRTSREENYNSAKEASQDYQERFSGFVYSDRGIKLSTAEKESIRKAIKTGYATVTKDGLTGKVTTATHTYVFDVIGDDAVVIKKVSNAKLNIHQNDVRKEYRNGRASGNQRAGAQSQSARSGRGNGSDDLSSGRRGATEVKTDVLDETASESDGIGDLPEGERNSKRTERLSKNADNKAPTKNVDVRYSREEDADYMAAVERGDMETAQRMVDEAAKAAGYDTPKLYHGTRAFGFTQFDTNKSDDGISLFATDNPKTAETYSGKTGRTKIKDRSNYDASSLHGDELISKARENNKRYKDYKLMSEKDREQIREEARSSIGWSIRRAQEFVRDHNGAFDTDKAFIMDRLISALYHLRDSETEGDISDAWTEWEDAIWDLKGMDDSIAIEFLDDVDSRGLFQSKNELDDMTYLGDIYADWYPGGPDYVFDNQLQLELDAAQHQGIYELYGKPGKQLVIEANGANWNQITPPEELLLSGPQRTRDIAVAAKAKGYDSILFKSLRDNGGETPYNGESNVYIFFRPDALKSADPVTYDDNGNVIPLSERFNNEEQDIRYSREVDDEELLQKLNKAEREGVVDFKDIKPGDQKGVVKVYRAMQAQPVDENGNVIPNASVRRIVSYEPLTVEAKVFTGTGRNKKAEIITAPAKLFSPMAGQTNGVWRNPIALNKWEMSEGHPELATTQIDEKTGKPKIDTQKGNASYGEVAYWYGLNKGGVDDNGKAITRPVPARYNPYTHTSLSALNDQFSAAEKRPELVTVETLIPVWHINNGENNERLPLAKNRVGAMSWHSGPTSSRLAKIGKARTVILTRYDKPVRVVPDAEVAKSIAENIGDSKNVAIPASVVTPSLANELRAQGVKVLNDEEWKQYAEQFPTEKFGKLSGNMMSRDEEEVSYAELRKQNEDLRSRVEYWKGQTKRTTAPTARAEDAAKAAREIVKGYASTADVKDVAQDIKDLTEYVMQADNLSWSEVKDRAVGIAREIIHNAEELRSDDSGMYDEISATLKKPLLISQQDAHDVPPDNWGAYRNSIRDRVNVSINGKGTPVDTAYAELAERFPSLFPADITHPADQLQHMVEVMNELAPVYDNPFSYNMAEAIEYCANDIIDRVLGENIRQTPPTFADKAAARLAAEKARGAQKAAQVREEKNAQIERIMSRNAERTAQAVAREREARDRKIKALKDHYADMKKAAAERKADRAARTKLLNIAKRLQNKKLPAVSRALLDQYIGDLDTVAKSITGQSIEYLETLRDWYESKKENDPDFISDPATEERIKRLYKKRISDLSSAEVAELTEALKNIENEIRTEKQLIDSEDRRDTYLQGVQTIEDVKASKGSKKGPLDKLIVTETLSPLRQMHRVTGYNETDPLYQRTQELADGQRKMFDYQMRAFQKFNRFMEDKKFINGLAGKNAQWIEVTGYGSDGKPVTVKITPAMRMSLYLHSLNDQNLKHIKEGGITIPDEALYRKGNIAEAYTSGTTIKLTPSAVRSIAAGMTEKERAFAKAAHDYFNGMSRDEINAVSEKLKGYSLAQVENYFPINTDTAFTKKDFESLKFDGTLEGMGFLKERVNAANPIMLRDMNDVLTQSINQHSRYVGLAIPVRNFNKVWGVTQASFNEDGSRNSFESSVQKAVGQKWGKGAVDYIEKMMTDLQNSGGKVDSWDKLFGKIRSNYAQAVLTLNLSVAMKQAASYPTAAAVLGWAPLARAMADVGKVDLDKIAKYTPLQWYRSQGYSSQELGDMAKRGMKLPAVLNWVQGIDLLTTRKLWKASEYYVRQNNKALNVGSDAYYQAVADVYNRVIEETQPNYTTMQRPQLLRSDSTLLQNLAMFKTQPFQNFNILYDAYGNLEAKRAAYHNTGTEEAKAEYREAQKRAAWATESQLVSLAVFAAMTFAWARLRGKDDKYRDKDGNLTPESVLGGIGKNMLSGAFGMVPFGTEVYDLLASKVFGDKYYGVDAVTPSAISDLFSNLSNASDTLWKELNGAISGEKVDWNALRFKMEPTINATSKVLGVPVENVTNLFNLAYRQTARRIAGEYAGQYAYLRLTANPEKKAAQYYDNLYAAYQHSPEQYAEILQDMLDSGDFAEDKIKNAMESRMKASQGVNKVSDLDQRWMAPEQQATYDDVMQSVQASKLYGNASEDQLAKLADAMYDYSIGNSSGKATADKIAGGESVGLDAGEYFLYTLALEMADKPTDSGKMGTYTNDEYEEAIRNVPGLTNAERSYLWSTTHSSDKNNPWAK